MKTLLLKLLQFFKSKKLKPERGKGLILLNEMPEVFNAEKLLKDANYNIKIVAPPLQLRKGCDLAVEIDIVERTGIERILLENKLQPIDIIPLQESSLEPLEIVKVVDFGDLVMVRASNMKMTIEKRTGIIRNISGGGCPDVPYLHQELVDKKIDEVLRPKELGFTLCALMLDRAFDECLRIYQENNKENR